MKTLTNGLAFLVVIGVLGLSFYSLKDSPELFVPEITISSEASPSSAMVKKISADLAKSLEEFEGLPVWEVSIQEIHELLSEDRRLESFQVKRRLPNQIHVSLEPKKPLAALLMEKTSEVFPLSADGSLLAAMSLAEAPNLPLVRGAFLKNNAELRRQLVEVLSVIPREGLFSLKEISEVLMSKDKEVSVVMNSGGTKVLLGATLAEKQVNRIDQVLNYLKSRSIKGRVIDARFSKKVVVRVRKAS